MARHKSALVALKRLEKSYEQHRRALLRKAQDEMAATVDRLVGELAGIARNFPAVVSQAVGPLVVSASTAPASKATPAAATSVTASANGHEGEAAGRFRAMGVKAHRAKLGLSGKDYGRLVGVSELTIYSWESGKSKPREAQKAKWLTIRALGKEEALRRLGKAAPKAGPAAAKPMAQARRKRGSFKQTAEEMILSLLKGRKALTSELAAEWKKAGRGGKVDNVLSRMVKDRKLIRKSLGGKKGSEYTIA